MNTKISLDKSNFVKRDTPSMPLNLSYRERVSLASKWREENGMEFLKSDESGYFLIDNQDGNGKKV
tara:strand:+ start:266 stop:463 length:198 start_codon:yes stop_codon:yes gene_type:complete